VRGCAHYRRTGRVHLATVPIALFLNALRPTAS
jgi:hypothetical protein